MGKVVLVRPNGTKTEVDEGQVKNLETLGYRRESQEEFVDRAAESTNKEFYSQPLQKLETAAEGWAGAATLGVSDKLNPDQEGARQRARYNPGHRIAGELGAGILGSVVIPGGAAKSVAGRIGAEAGVGALMGAGNALTESSLTGDPLTTSSLLAHAGVGALLSTGTAIAGESLIGLGNKLRARKLAEGAEDAVESFNPKQDTLASFYKSLPEEKIKPRSDVPEWIKADRATADDELIKQFTTTRESYTAKPFNDGSYASFRSSLDDVVKTTNQVNVDITDAVKTTQTQLKEFRRQMESTAADLDAAVRVTKRSARELDAVDSAGEIAFSGLESQYKTIKKALAEEDPVKALSVLERYKARIKEHPNMGGSVGASLPPTPDSKVALKLRDMVTRSQQAMKEAENVIKLKAVAKELSGFPKTQEEFVKLTGPKLERLSGALDKAPQDFDLSSIDRLMEDIGVSSSGSYGEKLRAIHQAVKEAKVFQATSKEVKATRFEFPNTPKDAATVVHEKEPSFEDLIRSEPKKPEFPLIEYGPGDGSVENVVVRGRGGSQGTKSTFWGRAAKLAGARKASAVAKHLGLGVTGSALAYEAGGGLIHSILGGGLIAGVVGAKTAVVGRIADGVAKYGPGLGRGIKKVGPRIDPLLTRLTGDYEPAEPKRSEKQLVKDRSAEITSAGPGFKDAIFMAVQPVMGEYPEFAKGLMDSAIVAYNGLLQFVPRDPGLAYSRLNTLWKPTDIQVAQFRKAYSVFHDPAGAIDSMLLDGKPDVTTVKALKTMYPPLYQELQSRMVQRVSNPEFLNSLSYEEQAKLSIMIEIPLHSSFTPRSIAQTQSLYARALQNRPPPNQGEGSGAGRPQKMEPPTAGQSLISR